MKQIKSIYLYTKKQTVVEKRKTVCFYLFILYVSFSTAYNTVYTVCYAHKIIITVDQKYHKLPILRRLFCGVKYKTACLLVHPF